MVTTVIREAARHVTELQDVSALGSGSESELTVSHLAASVTEERHEPREKTRERAREKSW